MFQWNGIYKLIFEKYLLNKNISSNIHILDNDILINKPEKIIKNVLNFCELKYDKFLVKKMCNLVKLKKKNKKQIKNKSRIEIDNIKLYKKILTEFVKQ